MVYTVCALITRGRRLVADEFVRPGIQLAAGVVVIAALGLLGSVFLTATANGIAIFMVFGAGLLAGAPRPDRRSARLERRLQTSPTGPRWALPFEALYQDALYRITSESRGLTGLVIQLLGRSADRVAPAPTCRFWVLCLPMSPPRSGSRSPRSPGGISSRRPDRFPRAPIPSTSSSTTSPG